MIAGTSIVKSIDIKSLRSLKYCTQVHIITLQNMPIIIESVRSSPDQGHLLVQALTAFNLNVVEKHLPVANPTQTLTSLQPHRRRTSYTQLAVQTHQGDALASLISHDAL